MSEPDADDVDAEETEAGPSHGDVEPDDADREDVAPETESDPAETLQRILAGEADGDEDLPDVEPDDGLVESVADAEPERVATELLALRERVETLEADLAEREAEVEDLESRLARKQADFQNYKQRQQERMDEEKQRATEDLVARLLDVRDNLARAVDQDEDADIRGGVESTLRQLDEEFERENVEIVEPEPGDETDPQRHEVLMRVESDQPEGTVADVHRSGYEMAGKVLRAAQVTVSEGSASDDDADEADDE